MKKYIRVILACLFIGISYNLFLMPNNLVPTGLIGLGSLFELTYGYNAAIFIAISNIILLLLSLPILGIKHTYKYLLTSFLIPLFIFLTKDINLLININNLETIIIAIFGAGIIGFAYSMIYKEDLSIGGFEIVQDIFNKTDINQSKFISYFIDFIVIFLTIFVISFEYAVYSTIITLIIIYLSTKAKFNISNNKSFFIITTKENEVKNYLLNK